MTARKARGHQHGAIALLLLLVLVLTVAGVSVSFLSARLGQQRQDSLHAKVLAASRDALAGEFTRRQRGSVAPFGLPCPDRLNNDGIADPPCNTAATSIGRLPWLTLGVGDLRDASGERLWYAVSPNWGDAATRAGLTTTATLSVLAPDGAVVHPNGLGAQAAVAIVLAPGAALQRMGAGAVQARATNLAADYLDRCAPPLCGATEDNSDVNNVFVASPSGPLSDGAGQQRFNDQLLVLTRGDLCDAKRTGGGANAC